MPKGELTSDNTTGTTLMFDPETGRIEMWAEVMRDLTELIEGRHERNGN